MRVVITGGAGFVGSHLVRQLLAEGTEVHVICRPASDFWRLADVAEVKISDGAPMLKSENARLSGWVYVDLHGRDLRSAVHEMQREVTAKVKLPPGYSIAWSGQFEYLERASARLAYVVPFTLLIVFVLLFVTFQRFDEALLIMLALPFALVGGVWLLWLLGHNVSVASGVGFIALAGVAAEFGVIMLLYLKHAWDERVAQGRTTEADLLDAIREGAVLRVRPKAMTVAVIFAGLLPIMVTHTLRDEVAFNLRGVASYAKTMVFGQTPVTMDMKRRAWANR